MRQPFRLDGRVALVTGAGRGIGRAVALVLSQAGAAVGLVGRSAEPLQAVAAELVAAGGRTAVLVADVGDAQQVQAAVERCNAELGTVDILVNNAGVSLRGPIQDVSLEAWDATLRANLTGAFLCSRVVADGMCARGWGRIVNISSVTAQSGGVTGSVAYSASKGGMLAFTRTLARDLAPYNVTVNAVTPGQIDTRMSDETPSEELKAVLAQIPLGRLGSPEDIAYAVLFLASEEAGYVTGATLDVNGGILKR
jgi:3-oxoacyl-[acyl-carrier protein] reductase